MLCFLLITGTLLVLSRPVYADDIATITQGVARTLFSVFDLPKDMITGATNSFPLGLITGTITGTMKMVTGTVLGVADIARGAAPYAKYAALAFI